MTLYDVLTLITFCDVVFGQEIKHVKIGHVKIDRAHFRVHFREHWKISREHWKFSREHSRGSFRGDPLVCFTQKEPQPSWAFSWTSSCTLSWAFSWALSWESSWVKFRGSRALCSSDVCQVKKASEIVIKCRKVSQCAAKCRKLSQDVANCCDVSPSPIPFPLSHDPRRRAPNQLSN